ncbi:hypothetical protein HYU93_02670 [Candidatus Daviesbacteria bacterium]|nr:hypothetical protein [Candidatus Daviesbacteria bacterium]
MDNNFYTTTKTVRIPFTYGVVNYGNIFKNIVSKVTSYLGDEESVFNELVSNKTFLAEAKEARKQILTNPSHFTNFTQKYAHLIR